MRVFLPLYISTRTKEPQKSGRKRRRKLLVRALVGISARRKTRRTNQGYKYNVQHNYVTTIFNRQATTHTTRRVNVGRLASSSPYKDASIADNSLRVQELCESRGGRPGLSVLMSLTVYVDVKQH